MSAWIRVRGLAWPILERLGRLDSGSNPDGPTRLPESFITLCLQRVITQRLKAHIMHSALNQRFIAPVFFVLIMLSAPLSGCFGSEDSSTLKQFEFEIEQSPVGENPLRSGETHDFILRGDIAIQVPATIILIINGSVLPSGQIVANGTDVHGQIMVPPTTTGNVSIEVNDKSMKLEIVAGDPIISGKDWFDKMEFITSVCSDSTECGGYINRWMGTPNPAFERAVSFFQGHFEGLGYETHILRVIDHLNPTQPESVNIIAWKRGRSSECVQGMGAHMDIAPPGGPPGGGTYEGAYDNTAGPLSMMLFARELVNMEVECDTFLGLWSSEEEGLRGSSAFATNDCDYCLPHDKELRFYINMDMMGVSWPALKPSGEPYPYHAWSGPDEDPEVVEQPITGVMEYIHFDILQAPKNLTIDGTYGAGCDQHWDEHENLTLDVHEDTFGRSDHVTFRNLGAQTIFHLGAYDADYDAYHSPSDTLDNMVQMVGGQEELENSIEFVMWAAYLEFLYADQTPTVANVG